MGAYRTGAPLARAETTGSASITGGHRRKGEHGVLAASAVRAPTLCAPTPGRRFVRASCAADACRDNAHTLCAGPPDSAFHQTIFSHARSQFNFRRRRALG